MKARDMRATQLKKEDATKGKKKEGIATTKKDETVEELRALVLKLSTHVAIPLVEKKNILTRANIYELEETIEEEALSYDKLVSSIYHIGMGPRNMLRKPYVLGTMAKNQKWEPPYGPNSFQSS